VGVVVVLGVGGLVTGVVVFVKVGGGVGGVGVGVGGVGGGKGGGGVGGGGDSRFDCRWSRKLAVLSDWLHVSFKFCTLSYTSSQLITHILLPLDSKSRPVTGPEGPRGF